jgi:hypothetical protein
MGKTNGKGVEMEIEKKRNWIGERGSVFHISFLKFRLKFIKDSKLKSEVQKEILSL